MRAMSTTGRKWLGRASGGYTAAIATLRTRTPPRAAAISASLSKTKPRPGPCFTSSRRRSVAG